MAAIDALASFQEDTGGMLSDDWFTASGTGDSPIDWEESSAEEIGDLVDNETLEFFVTQMEDVFNDIGKTAVETKEKIDDRIQNWGQPTH